MVAVVPGLPAQNNWKGGTRLALWALSIRPCHTVERHGAKCAHVHSSRGGVLQKYRAASPSVSLSSYCLFAAIVWLAVMWSRAKGRADRAEGELLWLRSTYNQATGGLGPPPP